MHGGAIRLANRLVRSCTRGQRGHVVFCFLST